MCQWKNFENRLIFDEDYGQSQSGTFFWDTVYNWVRVHIGLQICEGKFISIKSRPTRRYIYANFGTFLAPPGITYIYGWMSYEKRKTQVDLHASSQYFFRRQLTQIVVVMTTITQSPVAATVAMTTDDQDELRCNPSQCTVFH